MQQGVTRGRSEEILSLGATVSNFKPDFHRNIAFSLNMNYQCCLNETHKVLVFDLDNLHFIHWFKCSCTYSPAEGSQLKCLFMRRDHNLLLVSKDLSPM